MAEDSYWRDEVAAQPSLGWRRACDVLWGVALGFLICSALSALATP